MKASKVSAAGLRALTAVISAAILGLSAHSVAWQRESRHYRVRVYQSPESGGGNGYDSDTGTTIFEYTVHQFSNWMSYHAPLTMTDTYGLLVAGAIGTVLGMVTLVLNRSRIANEHGVATRSRRSERIPCFPVPLAVIFFCDGILAVIATIATGIYWTLHYTTLQGFGAGNPYFLPRHHVNHTIDLSTREFGGHWTFENWNCQLREYAIYLGGEEGNEVSGPKVWTTCELAQATRYLTVPLLVLALGMLGLSWWAWRRSRRSRLDDGGYQDDDSTVGKKGELEGSLGSGGGRESREKSAVEAHSTGLYEMPACRLSKVELDDAGYREMEGDSGGRELGGAEVAVEAPGADESRRSSVDCTEGRMKLHWDVV